MRDLDATFAYYINYTGIPDTSATALPCNPEVIDLTGWWDPQPQRHINILNKLKNESPIFRQFYVTRQADLFKTVFSCDNMLSYLDSIIATIGPEMPSHIARWGRRGSNGRKMWSAFDTSWNDAAPTSMRALA